MHHGKDKCLQWGKDRQSTDECGRRGLPGQLMKNVQCSPRDKDGKGNGGLEWVGGACIHGL